MEQVVGLGRSSVAVAAGQTLSRPRGPDTESRWAASMYAASDSMLACVPERNVRRTSDDAQQHSMSLYRFLTWEWCSLYVVTLVGQTLVEPQAQGLLVHKRPASKS